MKICDNLAQGQFSLSVEVFPPVRDGNIESLYRTIEYLGELQPVKHIIAKLTLPKEK
ncbi:MAG: hypothetical protein PHN75_09915 [Syntrophales bacterium]|nr:hypothetical protein [Syntrophales bacterium]